MQLPPVIRTFFAVDLSINAKEQLGDFISALRQKSKSNAIRWTKPENLHITLHFLPTVRSEDLPKLIENVRAKMEEREGAIEFKLGALHIFPNRYHPRVIVLDLNPQQELTSLAEYVGRGISASHYEVETRPFRGHLTLGRIKQPKETGLKFLTETIVPEFAAVRIEEIILFRSEPQQDGSRYTPLERIKLKR